MENEEFKKALNRLHIPEPSDEAKDRAIQSAMAEFRLHAEKNKNRVKGFAWLDRLISKKTIGGFFMNRTIAISTAGLAVSVIVFAVVFSPTMISRVRQNYTPVTTHKTPDITELKEVKGASPQKIQTASDLTVAVNVDGANNSNNTGQGLYDVERVEEFSGPQKTGGDNEDFAMEEIMATPQKREAVQQEAPISIDVISGKGLYKTGTLARNESASKGSARNEGEIANTLSLYSSAFETLEDSQGPIEPQYVGRDRFEDIKTNTVKIVSEEPVSTFSIDVDTASYAFVRRALNSGYLPQADSVRIEEMINYFDYDYPLPRDKSKPFKPTVAIFQTPWNANTRLLHIGIKGYDIVQDKRPGANLTFLIDVSGSMRSEDKLPLLKNSLRMLVETLNPDDTIAIAVYAGAAGTVLERTNASEKQKILAAIDNLQAGGSTAGGEGIKLAYSLAEADMNTKAVNRVILATDGDFNVGITDKDVLQDFVERKRKSGIYLSVLGFGQGNYNDALMQRLAQNGNGNAAYIDNLNEARKVLVDEATGTLFTIAKDVKIQVEFNPDMISEYRLIGYETRQLNREDFKNDNVDAGDIGSGHSVTAIYEITPKGSDAKLIDDLRYGSKKDSEGTKKSGNASEYAFLKIRYKLPDEDTSREISTPIDKGNEYKKISDVPNDSRFASAVAAFGQLLRGDAYINQFTYDDVIALANDAKKDDPFGYRAEFINLVRLAKTASAMGDR